MVFKTKNGNFYLYSPTGNKIVVIHPVLYEIIKLKNKGIDINDRLKKCSGDKIKIKDYGYVSLSEIDYYYQKYLLFKEKKYFKKGEVDPFINGRLTPEKIKLGLHNNKDIVFEVTDACNLKCKYCAYGEYYNNYEKRDNKKLSIKKARRLIDYLVNIWNSDTNKSQNSEIRIGFYGGEPLLNVPLIKEIVQYTKKINLFYNYFTYGITTNGVLLDKSMDFLVKNNFNILISLDGNKKNNAYRVFPDGKSSYETVYKNILLFKKRFPGYFEKNVSFISVVHRLNSVESIYNYFKTHFNKTSRLSEVDPTGIKQSKKEEFLKTYKRIENSLKGSKKRLEIEKEMTGATPRGDQLVRFLNTFTGCTFVDYDDLIDPDETRVYFLPTGTCIPFTRKIFLSVSGKIYPCERVGNEHALGYVTEKKVVINFKKIADKYNHYYDKLIDQCSACEHARGCPVCMLKTEITARDFKCPYFTDKKHLKKSFSNIMTYLEENPELYSRIMEEVFLE
jgi:uncharacterized protein